MESARARDLIGVVLLAGATLYVWRTQHTTPWFLAASAVAIVAQLGSFYLRSAAPEPPAGPTVEIDEDADEDLAICPSCGHAALIELEDTARLLGGLSQHTAVTAAVCPECGALSGQVEDPTKIPLGPQHGTNLRRSPGSEDNEALEEAAEHDG